MGLEFQRAKQRTSSLPKTTTEAGSPCNCTCILCTAGWDCTGVLQDHRSSGFSSHGGIFIHGHWPRDCRLCSVTALMQERKRALVCLSVWGLSFMCIMGYMQQSSNDQSVCICVGLRSIQIRLKASCVLSRSCCVVNPFLKTFFSSCWGCPLPR